MNKIIFVFFIVICSMSLLIAKPFKILDIKKVTIEDAKWTSDGKKWKVLKKGDSFRDSLIGFSIPKGVSVVISYKKSNETYKGPRNILLSHIKKDLSKSEASSNIFLSVLSGVQDVLFSHSQVSEASSRGTTDVQERDITLLFLNGLPSIISETQIRTVEFYYDDIDDVTKGYELISESVNSNQFSFGKIDLSEFYKKEALASSDFFTLQIILENEKKHQFIVKFISSEEYKIYKTHGVKFKTLTENIYTSQEYINTMKIRRFVGRVQIKL